MTCLMSQRITRHKYISNELSWAQFWVEEDLQKLTATALCLEAASLCSFWQVLGDLISEKENEVKIEKFHLGWKVDSKSFPMSYHTPNLDTRKASKRLLKNELCSVRRIQRACGALSHQARNSPKLFLQNALFMARCIGFLSAAHREIWLHFHSSAQNFAQFWLVSLPHVIFDLYWCNLMTMM